MLMYVCTLRFSLVARLALKENLGAKPSPHVSETKVRLYSSAEYNIPGLYLIQTIETILDKSL